MVILITGVNGMLGKALSTELLKSHTIIGLDTDKKNLGDSDIEYYECDITDINILKRNTKEISPELIINCAAYTNVDGCETNKEKAHLVNVIGMHNIIEFAREKQAAVFQISTDYVFDGTKGPYSEYDITNPINYYGETKLDAELELIQSGLVWTIIRTNVLFSTSLTDKSSFVSWVFQKLSNNEKIFVVNDQFCNPTSVYHMVGAISDMIKQKAHGIYHYAGKNYLNRFEFALQIADTYNLDNRLINKTTTRSLKQKAARPYKAGLKTEKIETELNIQTFYTKDTLHFMMRSGGTDE